MSQCNDILRWLKAGKSLTAIEALNMFGCFRLAARIYDLRCKGYDIKSLDIRFGEKIVSEYRLYQ